MNRCNWCGGHGLVKICYRDGSAYDLAACQCKAGQWWRQAGMMRAWVEQHQATPEQIGRLEEFFTEAELATTSGQQQKSA